VANDDTADAAATGTGPRRHRRGHAVHRSPTGGAERLLTIHRSRPDGYCVGCSASRARWPCSTAVIGVAVLTRTLGEH
jgi:hypothetical protein